jgi:hypothetical protein
MALGAIADIAFALGATLLGFGGLTRQRVASATVDMPLDEALRVIPLEFTQSQFGLMWVLRVAARNLDDRRLRLHVRIVQI